LPSHDFKNKQLYFTRKMVVRGAMTPAADYIKVRGFFERIRAVEAAPVVLAKK
jgi:hypothetical protein